MKNIFSLLLAVAVALSTSAGHAQNLKTTIESYIAAVDRAIDGYNKAERKKAAGQPFTESAKDAGLKVAIAKLRKANVHSAAAKLPEPRRTQVRELVQPNDMKLSEVERKLDLLLQSNQQNSEGTLSRPSQGSSAATTSHQQGVTIVRVTIGGSGSTHRHQMLLAVANDGVQSRYFLVDGQSNMVETKPLLLRAFLAERLGSQKQSVATEPPPDTVASDVAELMEKLKTAKPEVVQQFVASFTLQESALFASEISAGALNDAELSQVKLLEGELSSERTRRLTELQGLGMKGDDIDRVDASIVARKWLSDKNSRDLRLYQELLEGTNLDIKLGKPGQAPVFLPVRTGSRVDANTPKVLNVDNFKFTPDQIRSIELPRTATPAP
ncbi:hypothetical protein [Sorangium sp. So ce341]|uniref:hypothetical protein n=1 Tax=Sorangium sp. So ce341 TaxID=3133302 RepID=UPI003F5DD96F